MMQQNNQTTSKDEGSQQTPGTSKFVATNSSPATKGKRYVQQQNQIYQTNSTSIRQYASQNEHDQQH